MKPRPKPKKISFIKLTTNNNKTEKKINIKKTKNESQSRTIAKNSSNIIHSRS